MSSRLQSDTENRSNEDAGACHLAVTANDDQPAEIRRTRDDARRVVFDYIEVFFQP